MATTRKSSQMAIGVSIAALVAILSLLSIHPPTCNALSGVYYRAKISLIDWGVIRYGHWMNGCLDRLAAYDCLAKSGQVLKLEFTFDRALTSQESLTVLKSQIPHLDMHLTTGKRTDVLLFVDTLESVDTWKTHLDTLNAGFNATKTILDTR